MKVFISWSGSRSETVARKLRDWLPDIIQSVRPWMSEVDISPGARWGNEVERELTESRFGILCLTRENLTAPWILFEAGALAKTIQDTFVCPYLIDLEPVDIPAGPLTQFQAKRAHENGTWELVERINASLNDGALSAARLRRVFDPHWPAMKAVIDQAAAGAPIVRQQRSPEDVAAETLELVRAISRRITTPDPMSSVPSQNTALENLRERLRKEPDLVPFAGHSQIGFNGDDLNLAIRTEEPDETHVFTINVPNWWVLKEWEIDPLIVRPLLQKLARSPLKQEGRI